MTGKTRTILFSICAFLFLVSALAVVFYSQGYRFDFEKKRVTQTGAFYFKVSPKSSRVYLDGKFKKKTDFLFGALLIENLLPRKYAVQIKKEGYLPWEKTLEIKEKQVTEAKNIVLIPENPSFTILAGKVEDFFFSPDEKKIILREISENGWQIKLYDLRSLVKSYLLGGEDILKSYKLETGGQLPKIDFLDLKFSPDSKRILLKVGQKEDSRYFLLDLDSPTQKGLSSLDFLGPGLEDVFFNPENPQKLFLFKTGSLFEGDLNKKEISLPLLKNVLSYQIFNKNIYYLDDSGFLFKTNLSFGPSERINATAFPLERGAKKELYITPDFLFLREGQNLYSLNPDFKVFEKLFDTAKDLKISPDFKKIAYFSDFEIWVLFLKEQLSQPQKLAGEKLFLTRFSEKIGEVFWFGSHYLIFNTGNQIKIAEIDDRDRINIVDLSTKKAGAEFENPEIFWSKNNKELYILNRGNLYKSEKLIK